MGGKGKGKMGIKSDQLWPGFYNECTQDAEDLLPIFPLRNKWPKGLKYISLLYRGLRTNYRKNCLYFEMFFCYIKT